MDGVGQLIGRWWRRRSVHGGAMAPNFGEEAGGFGK
jgi:hypothetical protein